jgi:aminoglycoside 3-N-acetyltransferase I
LNLEIQILKSDDLEGLKELITVFENVFEMENFKLPNETHLQRLLKKETFIAVVAKTENKIMAGLTVYVLDQYYSTKPLAYIYDLAVMTEYQRQGVGKKLMEFTTEYCRQKGFEEVFVQADKVDAYAIDFYRSTKPTQEEQAVHFSYLLKPDIGMSNGSRK